MMTIIKQKSIQLGKQLKLQKILVATAESCTGGWVSEAITAIPGSSSWFDRGFVTYSNAAKQEMLGVKAITLDQFGAVSEETASEMAAGALKNSQAQLSVSITGIAGPDGGSDDKPVGTVWFAWADQNSIISKQHIFTGDRASIREQAVITALDGLLELSKK